MRVCIVTPSEEFSASAGVRIRYDRLTAAARMIGHEISLQPIGEFQSAGDFVHDAYIFAKTYTPVSTLLAWRMRQEGKRVGLDIFDDYFTQTDDPRLLRYRLWFADMNEVADFHLCSTPRLAAAIAPLLNGKPLQVIDDPSDVLDPQLLVHLLAAKAKRRASEKSIRILWFGIGDNPFFPVGLRDLSAFGHQLAAFRAPGSAVSLRILTNTRALTADGLASLRRLPVPYTIEEWTPDRERSELRQADVCFIPVNAQPFSRVKSLNRAISALAEGCQVLSAGFPLYDALGEFIYRSAEVLRNDLHTEEPALSPVTLPALISRLTDIANPYTGAERLFGHIKAAPSLPIEAEAPDATDLPPVIAGYASRLAVVHGAQPEGRLQKLARRFGGLTVKGPSCREDWNCQIRLDLTAQGRLRVLVENGICAMVHDDFKPFLMPAGRIKDHDFHELLLDKTPLAPLVRGWPGSDPVSLIRMYAAAPRFESDALAICRSIMPSVRFLPNEKLAVVAPAMRYAS